MWSTIEWSLCSCLVLICSQYFLFYYFLPSCATQKVVSSRSPPRPGYTLKSSTLPVNGRSGADYMVITFYTLFTLKICDSILYKSSHSHFGDGGNSAGKCPLARHASAFYNALHPLLFFHPYFRCCQLF